MAAEEDPTPQSEDVLFGAAEVPWDAGRYEEALPHFRSLTRHYPQAKYYGMQCTCERELPQLEEAEASARAMVELDPDAWLAWTQLAMCLEAHGNLPEAIIAYERSLSLRDNAYTRVLLASALRQNGDLAGARQQLEVCTHTFPEDDEAWFNLGCYWQDEDPERALRLMESALAMDPEYGYFHAGVAYLHGQAGHVERARHHLREARRLGSNHPEFEGLLESTSEWLLSIDRKRHPRRKPVAE